MESQEIINRENNYISKGRLPAALIRGTVTDICSATKSPRHKEKIEDSINVSKFVQLIENKAFFETWASALQMELPGAKRIGHSG